MANIIQLAFVVVSLISLIFGYKYPVNTKRFHFKLFSEETMTALIIASASYTVFFLDKRISNLGEKVTDVKNEIIDVKKEVNDVKKEIIDLRTDLTYKIDEQSKMIESLANATASVLLSLKSVRRDLRLKRPLRSNKNKPTMLNSTHHLADEN